MLKKVLLGVMVVFIAATTFALGKKMPEQPKDKSNIKMAGQMDSELVAPIENFLKMTDGGVTLHDLSAARLLLEKMFTGAPKIQGITSEERKIPGPEGSPDITVRIYRPEDKKEILPAILWNHGGGYVLGNLDTGEPWAGNLAKDLQYVVVSVDYRLAPEHPFPAGIEDSYAALKWVSNNADELGIDKSRIAIGGESAGAGLTAGLALLTRDRDEIDVAFQLLIYPMLDDRNVAPASDKLPDHFVWSRESNLIAWEAYLGHKPGGRKTSPYAAAARAKDLTNLPPAYIAVGEIDLFLNENIEYAQRLLEAGVPTELHVYPGAYHSFADFGPTAEVSKRFKGEVNQVMKHALQP